MKLIEKYHDANMFALTLETKKISLEVMSYLYDLIPSEMKYLVNSKLWYSESGLTKIHNGEYLLEYVVKPNSWR